MLLPGRETVDDLEWQQVRSPSGLEGWVALISSTISSRGRACTQTIKRHGNYKTSCHANYPTEVDYSTA